MVSRFAVLVVFAAFAVTVPTGAAVITDAGSETDAADGLQLTPSTGPNGDYATVSDGELRLDLENLNDDAVTRAGNVFTITVTDDDVERVWIENDVAGLAFYRGGDPTDTISKSDPLELSTDETAHIGVAIDTHTAQSGTETFSVVAEYDETAPESGSEPAIAGTNLTVSPTALETGDTLTANATYHNYGDETGTTTAALTVDGTVVDQRTLELRPGETKSVAFERTMYWPGAYEVGVEGVGSRRVTVEGPPIEVVNASVDDATVTAGESAMIRATVRNPTDAPVDRTLELAVDGIVVESRAVSIPADGERTVTFERAFAEPGTHDIAVSGVAAGEVTVEEPGPFAIRNRELSASTTAALAPPATAGLLFLAVTANRRWAILR
ncbi:CARDB domain-containing protein [Natrinema sp. 1APR25-10V2]|uniref:CARDB domain-containing protein n=1 Tax=Natrinema sp. 1APR25-10V2 TaxID=2951081 RepID=UPI00287B615B|nr:CARDB domain-containing protein [Natrinema sp. 1APR25-10V2]